MSLVVTFGERTPLLTPERSTPMTHLRSTVLVNSLKIVRDRGLDDEYWPRLQPETQETFRSMVALGWVPVGQAVEHYRVLNELIPNALDHWAIGKQAAERLQALYVRTVMSLLRASGTLTVPRALGRLRDAFDRMMQGGTVSVYQTGLKDAEVLLEDMPVLDTPYFRNNLAAWLSAVCQLAAKVVRLKVADVPGPHATLYRLSWV